MKGMSTVGFFTAPGERVWVTVEVTTVEEQGGEAVQRLAEEIAMEVVERHAAIEPREPPPGRAS